MALNSFTAPPAAAPAFLNMHVVSTNFAKTLVCKRENDVILWRQKECIFSTNDHHSPLFNTRIWKGGIQSSGDNVPDHWWSLSSHAHIATSYLYEAAAAIWEGLWPCGWLAWSWIVTSYPVPPNFTHWAAFKLCTALQNFYKFLVKPENLCTCASPGPRHGEMPPRDVSKSAALPSHGLKQSQVFQDGIIS